MEKLDLEPLRVWTADRVAMVIGVAGLFMGFIVGVVWLSRAMAGGG